MPKTSVRDSIVLVFCCLMVLFTFTWNLPNSDLQRRIIGVTKYVMLPLGLWQEWSMFTTPLQKGFAVRIHTVDQNGVESNLPTALSEKRIDTVPDPHTKLFYNLLYDNGVYRSAFLSRLCLDSANLTSASLQAADIPTAGVIDGKPELPLLPTYINLQTVQCVQ